jgi:osomolarity two-component system, sensor histidine kinase SLN1
MDIPTLTVISIDVTLAKDGQEALDKVKESMQQQKLFDLIFMDIQV